MFQDGTDVWRARHMWSQLCRGLGLCFVLQAPVVAVMPYGRSHAIALLLVACAAGAVTFVIVLGSGLLPLAKLACEYYGLAHLVMP